MHAYSLACVYIGSMSMRAQMWEKDSVVPPQECLCSPMVCERVSSYSKPLAKPVQNTTLINKRLINH